MVVCVCADVSERKLRKVIASGAMSLKAIERSCGAGVGCGACRPALRECLQQCRAEQTACATEHAPAAAAELVSV